MEHKITFKDVVRYAELCGAYHRQGESKAKDLSQTYWYSPWSYTPLMVLYEAPKRVLYGHKEAEVCWVCIDPEGELHNEAARNIRRMESRKGFGLSEMGKLKIEAVLGGERKKLHDLIACRGEDLI